MSKPPAWTEDDKYLRLDSRWTYKHVATEITWWPLTTSNANRGNGAEYVDWTCTHCSQSCWGWRTECYACRKPRATPTTAGTSNDPPVDSNNLVRTAQDKQTAQHTT